MDRDFKTTFIPKKKLTNTRNEEKSRRTSSLISLLAGLLFLTAIISIIGVYLYKMRIESVVSSRIESINRAEKAFEPAVILELKKLDIRLKAGTELLAKHVALSDFFDSFGESTLPSVTFSDFSYSYDSSGGEVSMKGEAQNYISIAQQSDLFEKNQYIKNPIFSNFAKTDLNLISFDLTFTLDPELTRYGRKIKNIQTKVKLNKDRIIENKRNRTVPAGTNVNFDNIVNPNQQ